ncbi:hypothetical protein V1524DRAFT_418529 [Lipomyces starkeyi]
MCWAIVLAHSVYNRMRQDDRAQHLITLLLDELAGLAVVTFVDIKNGYDQREIDLESRDLTAIQTPLGLLRLTRLPQGWTNKFIPHIISVFIDDIEVKCPSTTYDESIDEDGLRKFIPEHIDQLITVLKKLEMSGLKLPGIVRYLCTNEGRLPDPSKVRRVENWPGPQSVTAVRSFLGAVTYYRVWIKTFSKISKPLYELTKRASAFDWTDDHEVAFTS